MIYSVTLKNEDGYRLFGLVDATSLFDAAQSAQEEYANHDVIDVAESPYEFYVPRKPDLESDIHV